MQWSHLQSAYQLIVSKISFVHLLSSSYFVLPNPQIDLLTRMDSGPDQNKPFLITLFNSGADIMLDYCLSVLECVGLFGACLANAMLLFCYHR